MLMHIVNLKRMIQWLIYGLFLNKILYYNFYKAALHAAIEKNDVKMVQLLLSCDHIDVNRKYISKF